jgi:hypothetical protein
MYEEPKIIPLDSHGTLFAIRDEKGKIVGSGTKEVCEVMIFIMRKLRATNALSERIRVTETLRPNVRY